MLLWAYFFFLMIFWSFSFVAIRVCLDVMPPFAAAGLRVFLGAIFILAYALVTHKKLTAPPSMILKFIGIGVLNYGVAWAALFWGEQYINPGVASIVNSTVPIFVALCSWFFLRTEKPVMTDWLGTILGFVGISIVFLPSVRGFGAGPQELYGLTAVMIMSLAYAISVVLIRKWSGVIGSEWSFLLQAIGGTMTLALLSFVGESQTWWPALIASPKALAGLLYLAFFSTALAWVMYYKLIMNWGAIKSSAITYCLPFMAILADWVYFGHVPGKNHVIGGLLIISALLMLRVSKLRAKWHNFSAKSKVAA